MTATDSAAETDAQTIARRTPPPEPPELYFVLIKHVSRWTVFVRDDGSQAVATTLERAEMLLAEAKRFVDRYSKNGQLAAAGLRLARSREELL